MKCETAEGGETLNFIMCRTVECETAGTVHVAMVEHLTVRPRYYLFLF